MRDFVFSKNVEHLNCLYLPRSARPCRFPPNFRITDLDSTPAFRVLVVDDARDSLYVLGKLLEAIGHRVSTAEGGTRALEIACTDRPDVVISDIGMADMDGYELARRIRQDQNLAGTVLVALTGFGQDSDKQRTKEAGFDRHLVKPVSLEALRALFAALPAPRA